jgi:hypothetical protein
MRAGVGMEEMVAKVRPPKKTSMAEEDMLAKIADWPRKVMRSSANIHLTKRLPPSGERRGEPCKARCRDTGRSSLSSEEAIVRETHLN